MDLLCQRHLRIIRMNRFFLTLASPVPMRAANAEKTIQLSRRGNERIALDPIFFEQTEKL